MHRARTPPRALSRPWRRRQGERASERAFRMSFQSFQSLFWLLILCILCVVYCLPSASAPAFLCEIRTAYAGASSHRQWRVTGRYGVLSRAWGELAAAGAAGE